MRTSLMVIVILLSIAPGCRKRSEIPLTPWTEGSHDGVEAEPADAAREKPESDSEPESMDVLPESEAPAPMEAKPMAATPEEPAKKPEFMLLKFAHADNLCIEAMADGRTALQTCSPDSEGAKFLAVAALDGRVQYQNIKSKLCLASGGDRFTGFVIQMETCASKASQFFTKVAFDKVFALRQDAENRCLYAENGSRNPGARIVMFPCANDMAQRLVP